MVYGKVQGSRQLGPHTDPQNGKHFNHSRGHFGRNGHIRDKDSKALGGNLGGLHFKDERHSSRYQWQLLRFSCGAFLGHTTAKSYWGVIIVCPIFEVCVRGPFCFGALQPGGLKSGDFRFRRSCASLGMWACCGIPHKAGHHTHNFRTLHFRAARQVENEN